MISTMKRIKYSIAFRKNGGVFRVEKGRKLPPRHYHIIDGDKPGYLRHKYFRINGDLREEFNSLPIL